MGEGENHKRAEGKGGGEGRRWRNKREGWRGGLPGPPVLTKELPVCLKAVLPVCASEHLLGVMVCDPIGWEMLGEARMWVAWLQDFWELQFANHTETLQEGNRYAAIPGFL